MVCLMKLMTLNQMNQMRLSFMGLNPMRLNFMKLNLMRLNIMKLDLMKLNLTRLIINIIDIKPHEIKSYEPISNEDYYIENLKNEFNKLSNNLVEATTKNIRYIVDHINNGENLKEALISLENI